MDPKDKRTEVVHFKVNARENLDLYTSAKKCGMTVSEFDGLTSEEKRKLFHNRQLMEKWYNEVRPIADAVSEFIRSIRNMKMLHPRTVSNYRKEASSW